MPSNPLFWLVLAVVAIGYVATLSYLYSRESGSEEGFHTGRVPGYAYTDGRNVGLDASDVELPDGDWVPLRLETFHGGDRTRLIVSVVLDIRGDSLDPVRPFARSLAGEIQTRSEADAVFVQATARVRAEGRWEYLYAPDGRGWWGAEQVRHAYRSPVDSATIDY